MPISRFDFCDKKIQKMYFVLRGHKYLVDHWKKGGGGGGGGETVFGNSFRIGDIYFLFVGYV